jgi:hypothetical protein
MLLDTKGRRRGRADGLPKMLGLPILKAKLSFLASSFYLLYLTFSASLIDVEEESVARGSAEHW